MNSMSIDWRFRILTISGVVDLRFRSMDLSEPKYMGLTGATTHLYNVGAFFKATVIYFYL
jgi:hypothetical protein